MDNTQKTGFAFMALIFALALISDYGRAIAQPGMVEHVAQVAPRSITQPYSNAPVGVSQPQYGLVQTGVAQVMSMNGPGMFGQQPVMMPVFQVIQLQSADTAPPAGDVMKPSSMAPARTAPAAQEQASSPAAPPAMAGVAMSPSYAQQIGVMCTINGIQALTQNEASCSHAGGQVAAPSN
jgi:hypothetical protein